MPRITTKDLKALLKVIKGGKDTPTEGEQAAKAFKAEEAIGKKATEVQSQLAKDSVVRVPHPMNPKEIFQFPPGTPPDQAKAMVKEIILKRVREGEEKIELPSQLSSERIKELEAKEKELEHAKTVIQDLESRKDMTKVGPGLYMDENTGKYFTVTEKGHIEEARLDSKVLDEESIDFEKEAVSIEKELEDPVALYLVQQYEDILLKMTDNNSKELSAQLEEIKRLYSQRTGRQIDPYDEPPPNEFPAVIQREPVGWSPEIEKQNYKFFVDHIAKSVFSTEETPLTVHQSLTKLIAGLEKSDLHLPPEFKVVVDKLLKHPSIKTATIKLDSGRWFHDTGHASAGGVYRYKEHDVILNFNELSKREPYGQIYTLLHEGVHAATVRRLITDEKFRSELWKFVIKVAHRIEGKHYGFTNPEEFVAEIHTKKPFQEAINRAGLWDEYVERFGKLFGIPITAGSMQVLSEILEVRDGA